MRLRLRIIKEADRLRGIGSNNAENSVLRGYIETLLELPWDKESEDNQDLKNAARILDEDHYGLEKVKERVLEFLAVRVLTKGGRQPDSLPCRTAGYRKDVDRTFNRAGFE